MSQQIIFRDGPLHKHLTGRTGPGGSVNAIVQQSIYRYYSLIAMVSREVSLSKGEASLIVDTLNGCMFGRFDLSPKSLIFEVEDAIALNGLDKKWEVDGPTLIEKLNRYNHFHCAAIVEASDKFWANCNEDHAIEKAFGVMIDPVIYQYYGDDAEDLEIDAAN